MRLPPPHMDFAQDETDTASMLHSRKRPRNDSADYASMRPSGLQLPPLRPSDVPAVYPRQEYPAYPPPAMPRMLPALSQLLNPTIELPRATTPSVTRSYEQEPAYVPQPQYVHPPQQYHTQPQYERRVTTPSPPPSEVSMEEDDDAEDKTPWPTANEYYELLTEPSRQGNIPVYDLGVDPRGVPLQPEFIYSEPRSCMYFLKCDRLLGRGSFGFPRKKKTASSRKSDNGRRDSSKEFEWRKMSFVTGLPKKKPIVRYITATCYSKVHRDSAEKKKKVLRMHAVMLASEDGNGECGDYVLVHIRAGGAKRVGVRTQQNNMASSSPVLHGHPGAYHAETSYALDSERPMTPMLYGANSHEYNSMRLSASPQNKRRRGNMEMQSCPRQMPLWLSPPSREEAHEHYTHGDRYH
ncbi:hypothetical protein Poli38472_007932 [Pythium oligandrum]|uniref:Uncharacterized protein n=1 Tax=Pythium oligandrum TaxID=41045 RepID=A0A8K1CL64_PYTOL|nr:hypothetical protein Poli38472_007932 [Pythium oligandrum]|eukprot:TMW65290.1 hypothetical protein Poli38472_007932 [Pythium oligandrum]